MAWPTLHPEALLLCFTLTLWPSASHASTSSPAVPPTPISLPPEVQVAQEEEPSREGAEKHSQWVGAGG